MEDSDAQWNEKCGDKRKGSENQKNGRQERSQTKPWGTDGPPPPGWIEVYITETYH